jgi:hypothetical protein
VTKGEEQQANAAAAVVLPDCSVAVVEITHCGKRRGLLCWSECNVCCILLIVAKGEGCSSGLNAMFIVHYS